MTEATQPGVSEDSRENQMAEIAKAHRERLQEELTPVANADGDQTPAFEEEETEEEEEQTPEQKVEEPPTEEPEEAEELTVDGAKVKVPLSKIKEAGIRALQKESAADKRLEEATLLLRRAEEMQRQVAPKPEPKVEPLPPAEIVRKMRELDAKMFTEATTAEEYTALAEQKYALQDQWMKSTLEERDRRAEERRQQEALQAAQVAFVGELQKAHPDYQELTELRDTQGRLMGLKPDFESWLEKQPTMMQWAFLQSNDPNDAVEVLNRFKAFKKPVSGLDETREKKKQIDVVPSGSGKQVPKAEPKPETNSGYVAKLKAQRAAMRGEVNGDL